MAVFAETKVTDSELVGKIAYIRTSNRSGGAVYQCAKITKETQNTLVVMYVSKSNSDPKKVERTSEIIKKADIVSLKVRE